MDAERRVSDRVGSEKKLGARRIQTAATTGGSHEWRSRSKLKRRAREFLLGSRESEGPLVERELEVFVRVVQTFL